MSMAEKPQEEQQRWTAKRRPALVVSIIKGETSVQEAARKHGLKVAEVEDWRDRFLVAAENALRSRPKDEEAVAVLFRFAAVHMAQRSHTPLRQSAIPVLG
jgi:transposase-like protein